MMTDPTADMLTRIRNANKASADTVDMPLSKQKVEIARIMKAEGYIEDYESLPNRPKVGSGERTTNKSPAKQGQTLRVILKYAEDRSRTIHGIRRISKPGLRVYAKAGRLPRVLGGMGTAIISTSSGLMTGKDASRKRLGGEVVAHIW